MEWKEMGHELCPKGHDEELRDAQDKRGYTNRPFSLWRDTSGWGEKNGIDQTE